jgi:HPt (histidine-containing phosphotransfer) domain-containing protein
VLDQATAWDRVEGDRELLEELVQAFLDDYPKLLARIRSAIAAGDTATLHRSAHALKGAVGIFGAAAAAEAALRLETMGREGVLDGAADACGALDAELPRVRQALTELLANGPPAGEPPGGGMRQPGATPQEGATAPSSQP